MKNIIICGPACSGKDLLKKRFESRGFKPDVTYTTRKIRDGERDGFSYFFIGVDKFKSMIADGKFYEWAQHEENFYGTSKYQWESQDIFIMETEGISKILKEDRENCFIIYLDIPEYIRISRMSEERKWTETKILNRLSEDNRKFKDFKDFDLKITNPNF